MGEEKRERLGEDEAHRHDLVVLGLGFGFGVWFGGGRGDGGGGGLGGFGGFAVAGFGRAVSVWWTGPVCCHVWAHLVMFI